MGKGSKPRPIVKSVYDSNFDEINWTKTVENGTIQEAKIIRSKIGKAKRFVYK
jgi:hypothetical protein